MTNRNYILTLLVMFYQETVWTMGISRSVLLCFGKLNSNEFGWCNSTIMLCNTGIAQNITINVTFIKNLNDNQCSGICDTKDEHVMSNGIHNLSEKCLRMECNMTNFKIPSDHDGNGKDTGFVNVTYSCTDNTEIAEKADNITTKPPLTILTSANSQVTTTTGTISTTTSDDPFTAAIAVSVVIPVIIAVVVIAVMMYRRGKCKLTFFKCTERCDNHSPGMTDTYAMSSIANADPTYDLSRDVDVILCDVDYSEIHKVRKETDSEYNHVNLEKKQAVLDPTYNHIGHFTSSSGDTEQTYNLVGDKTSQETDSSTLQPDMYSHIGAMAKPASGHLVEESYAHINGVIKHASTSYERKHYDIAVFQSNCGPTEGVGN